MKTPKADAKKGATKKAAPRKTKANKQDREKVAEQTAQCITARGAFNAAKQALDTLREMAFADDIFVAGYATSALYRLLAEGCGIFENILKQSMAGKAEKGLEWQKIKPDGTCVKHDGRGNRERIKRIQEMFSKEEALPVLHYAHADKRDDLADTVQALGLGSDVGLNLGGGKRYSTKTPANEVAEVIFRFADSWRDKIGDGCVPFSLREHQYSEEEIEKIKMWGREYAAQLPGLSRNSESLKKWQDAALKFIPLYYTEEFQNHPDLAQLVKTQEKAGGRKIQQGEPARSAMRKAAKDAIKKAFCSIAKHGGE